MKKINTMSNVWGISPFRDSMVIFTASKEDGLHQDIFFVSTESFYAAKTSDTCFIYQINKSESIFLVTMDWKTNKYNGDYSILGAFQLGKGFAIANRESRSYHYIEPYATAATNLDFYFKKSGSIEGECLFDRNGDEIKIFSISRRSETQTINIPRDFEINASPTDGIFSKDFVMYVPLSNGQLIAIDIVLRKLKWKQERIGRTAIFENRIYCIADYTIKEVDANTGAILREEGMQDLIAKYGFRPTGEHRVYDDYIFIMASGKPGMVAIYDRKTLKFRELLKFDDMIPVGTDHLHWHNRKLYVLDFGKTLHLFEEE